MTVASETTMEIDYWLIQKQKERRKRLALKVVLYGVLIAAALAYISPFILSAISMFKSDPDISKHPTSLSFSRALGSPSLQGLKGLNKDSVDFPRWMINSVFVTVVVVTGRIIIASLAGYALSRMKFRGQRAVFFLIVLLMGIPGIVLIIPQFFMTKMSAISKSRGTMIPQ